MNYINRQRQHRVLAGAAGSRSSLPKTCYRPLLLLGAVEREVSLHPQQTGVLFRRRQQVQPHSIVLLKQSQQAWIISQH
jgi:hypothetical protein